MDPGEVPRGQAPWPDETIHPDEVPDLIAQGEYDEAVLDRADYLRRER